MKRALVRSAPAALLLALVVATAGCDLAMADLNVTETAEWRKTYQLDPGGEVQVGNVNGRIEVEPSSGNLVEVVAHKSARGASVETAKEALARTEIHEEVSAGRVRIETRHPSGRLLAGRSVNVRYVVRVPAGANVKFTTVNGAIEVERLDGRTTLETVNGGITAREVGGPIEASTVNGGIDVDLTRVPEGGARLECTNGGIELRLPRDAKADIAASVVNGGIDVEGLPVDATQKSRRRLEGRLNGGGPHIRLDGTNGGIRLSPR